MTDGIDSPLYGRDPLAARRAADAPAPRARRERGGEPHARRVGRLRIPRPASSGQRLLNLLSPSP